MVKVEVLTNCIGANKRLKAGEVVKLEDIVAEKLAMFGYVKILNKVNNQEDKTEEDKEALLEKAKELKIKGANDNWHIDTLRERIEKAMLENQEE